MLVERALSSSASLWLGKLLLVQACMTRSKASVQSLHLDVMLSWLHGILVRSPVKLSKLWVGKLLLVQASMTRSKAAVQSLQLDGMVSWLHSILVKEPCQAQQVYTLARCCLCKHV